MSQADEFKKNLNKHLHEPSLFDEEGEAGESGGGQTGEIAYRQFIGTGGENRDDLLTGTEKKQLMLEHESAHKGVVKKQKDERDKITDLREGKTSYAAYKQGRGIGAGNDQYKNHPTLSNSPQYSGAEVNALPNDDLSNTNQEQREELRYRNQLVNRPRFNPQPQR